jgi:hypothetical protein
MGGCRKDVPGGVSDIKRICERVAGRACKRMRTLLEMGKRGPEVLEELSVWFLAVESAHISQRRAQVHEQDGGRRAQITWGLGLGCGRDVPIAKHGIGRTRGVR